MKSAEGRGRTLEEAVDTALIQLGVSRRNVDVKILSESPDETHVEVKSGLAAGEELLLAVPEAGFRRPAPPTAGA